jgi:hypothetical protein
MKYFISNIIGFSFPFVVILIFVVYIDLFKVFKFSNYYDQNQIVTLNREMITTKTYLNNRVSQQYNSFIFGSSRSQAYKTSEWRKYLKPDSKCFHFDASWESVLGIYLKIKFIDKKGDILKNALIIIDEDILSQTNLKTGHLYIPLPEVSQNSIIQFYFTYVQATLNPLFLFSYIYYNLTNEYREWMGMFVTPIKLDKFTGDIITCDLYYPQDQMIIRDSVGYYEKLKQNGTFNQKKISDKKFNYETIESLLDSMLFIFEKYNTNYKIVISPNFDQKKMDSKLFNLLILKFGSSNVYNFSGKNEFTTDLSNYYESSHYRPLLADKILKKVYQTKMVKFSNTKVLNIDKSF